MSLPAGAAYAVGAADEPNAPNPPGEPNAPVVPSAPPVAGPIVGWGSVSSGQVQAPPGLRPVTALAAGSFHSLALQIDSTVAAWGSDRYGQVVVPPGLAGVIAITAGDYHSLALLGDGSVVAWGNDWYGQVSVPPSLANVVAIAAGGYHNLALTGDGAVVAWGDNRFSQNDVPPALSEVAAMAAGGFHSLALRRNGAVVAWGDSRFGQTAAPADLHGVVAIAAGGLHSLALRKDGTVVGWGENNFGQVSVPPELRDVIAVTAGVYHSLALKADGTVVGWGRNLEGQAEIPPGLAGVLAIEAGGFHSLALRDADATAPAAAPAVEGAAGRAGWYTSDVTVNWGWTDGGWGIDAARCPQRSNVSGEGEAVTVAAECYDLAGNRGTAALLFKIDKTAPATTIDQATDQPDPTEADSLRFTVVFAEPVSGFAADDVQVGGTAGATAVVVTGGPSVYEVLAQGMVQSGAVTPLVGVGAAADAAGNQNLAATSTDATVTYRRPQACDGRNSKIAIMLATDPPTARDVRFWGAYGNFRLDAPAADDGDGVNGSVAYDQVLPGTHNFSMSAPFGWTAGDATCTGQGTCVFVAPHTGLGITVRACEEVAATFTLLQRGALAVAAYVDANGDGQRQADEAGLPLRWSDLTTADGAGNAQLAASNFNDAAGFWRVLNLLPGRTYTVCQKPHDGWLNTQPGGVANDPRGWPCYRFMLAPGQSVEAAFGYTTGAANAASVDAAATGLHIKPLPADTEHLFLPLVVRE